jgi:Coenzyme PQQ synthesis protein D (PqqD)
MDHSMLAISKTIRRTQTQDGRILLDVERGQIFCLNVIGSKILDLLETGYDEGQIAEHVSEAYGADLDIVRTDVHDFLKTLNKHEILRCHPPATRNATEATDGSADAT